MECFSLAFLSLQFLEKKRKLLHSLLSISSRSPLLSFFLIPFFFFSSSMPTSSFLSSLQIVSFFSSSLRVVFVSSSSSSFLPRLSPCVCAGLVIKRAWYGNLRLKRRLLDQEYLGMSSSERKRERQLPRWRTRPSKEEDEQENEEEGKKERRTERKKKRTKEREKEQVLLGVSFGWFCISLHLFIYSVYTPIDLPVYSYRERFVYDACLQQV